jgi:effector-binding domain-containing protein
VRWIEEHGYRTDGFAREVYLDHDPDRAEQGVTERQMAITGG